MAARVAFGQVEEESSCGQYRQSRGPGQRGGVGPIAGSNGKFGQVAAALPARR